MKKQILILALIFSSSIFAQDLQISNSQISSAMLSQISVTIGGDFVTEGTFDASSNERVDQLVTRLFNLTRQSMYLTAKDNQMLTQVQQKYDNYAKRNIEIKHIDGSSQKIDLAKFRLDGDFTNNPYIKNGDVIIFPTLDLDRNFISIDGAVNNPIKIQFVEGDDLQTAIFFARGINLAYNDITKAEISRISDDGKTEETKIVSINEKYPLKRSDRIRVLFTENNKRDYKVLVLGEVKSPGFISITKDNTKILEVIKKAGNLTDRASKEFGKIFRGYSSTKYFENVMIKNQFSTDIYSMSSFNYLFENEKLEYFKMLRTANLTLEDSLMFAIDNNLRSMEFSPNFNFKNIDKEGTYENNFIVKDGDIIFLPTEENRVYVWGGVKNPGYFTFSQNFSIENYLEEAGGFTETAIGEEEIYLIKGKNRDWIKIEPEASNYKIESGDYIYAKKTPTRSFDFYLRRTGAVASIVGTVITTLYLIFTATGN